MFKINENAKAKIPSKVIVPALTLIVAAVFLKIGIGEYGFWNSATARPTKGFFPIIIAVGLVALSILAIIQAVSKKDVFVEFRLANWFVPLALVGIICLSFVTGLVISITVFEILWLRAYEKQSWKTTIITTLIALFIVVGCFQIWLGIELPKGLLFQNLTHIKFVRMFL